MPILNFYLRKKEDSEKSIQDLIANSVFKDHIKSLNFEELPSGQENLVGSRKNAKIESELSAIISGLKCFLQELGSEYVSNLVESFFNLDAKPFKPKPMKQNSETANVGPPLDLGFAQTPIQKSTGNS